MKIYDFTVPELNKFRELCNFTEDEMIYFNMKAKNKSHIQIAMELNVSEAQVAKLSKRVRSKILRVI